MRVIITHCSQFSLIPSSQETSHNRDANEAEQTDIGHAVVFILAQLFFFLGFFQFSAFLMATISMKQIVAINFIINFIYFIMFFCTYFLPVSFHFPR